MALPQNKREGILVSLLAALDAIDSTSGDFFLTPKINVRADQPILQYIRSIDTPEHMYFLSPGEEDQEHQGSQQKELALWEIFIIGIKRNVPTWIEPWEQREHREQLRDTLRNQMIADIKKAVTLEPTQGGQVLNTAVVNTRPIQVDIKELKEWAAVEVRLLMQYSFQAFNP